MLYKDIWERRKFRESIMILAKQVVLQLEAYRGISDFYYQIHKIGACQGNEVKNPPESQCCQFF